MNFNLHSFSQLYGVIDYEWWKKKKKIYIYIYIKVIHNNYNMSHQIIVKINIRL